MSFKPTWILLFCLLFTSSFFSQELDTKQKIAEKINQYFALDRENIHLHLNKDTFLTEESIWFKGYVYNRKQLSPFYNTTNVFVVLYDQTGTIISQQLAYSNTGTFEGVFKNLKNLSSGNYYIQTYTNWMNNFEENESSTYPIKIINLNQPHFYDIKKSNVATAKIEIQPEGGTLVNGIANNVGVKITDKFNNPIGNVVVELRDKMNKFVSEIAINNDGMGKFSHTPKNDSYTLILKTNDKVIEQKLPLPSIKGIALEVNNHSLNNRTTVKIKTNEITFTDINSKKLFLLVHQDQRALLLDVNIDPHSFEQNLLFSTEHLSPGINTIRIIDENMNQLAERTIVKISNSLPSFTFTKNLNANGYMQINGLSHQNDANLSVSILPSNSDATNKSTSIITDLLYNSYLENSIKELESYTKNPTIAKKYALDLILLNQSNQKYTWAQIIQNPPTAKHEFDVGLTIKGKLLSPTLKRKDAYNIRLRSFHHRILVQSRISENGDFEFKHLLLNDSVSVDIGLFKNTDDSPLKLSYNAKIINGKRNYKFPFLGRSSDELNEPHNSSFVELPDFYGDVVQLKAVDIEVDPTSLKRAKNIENNNLRGFKVPETMPISVLTYIEGNGFDVSRNNSEVSITVRGRTSINAAQAQPIIYIDNIQLTDYSLLDSMNMEELDEIYSNPHTIIPSINNFQGMIRMYRKAPKFSIPKTNLKYSELINGFARTPDFKNADYKSTWNQGFAYYGVINWISTLQTKQKKAFQMNVPNYNQKKVKVINFEVGS